MGFRWNQNPPEPPPSSKPAAATRQRPASAEQVSGFLSPFSSTPPSAAPAGGPQNVVSSIAFSPGRLFNPLAFEAESGLLLPPPPPPPNISLAFPASSAPVVLRGSSNHAGGPPASSCVVRHHQRLIPPNTAFARAVVMGNVTHGGASKNAAGHVVSNLAVQMNQTSDEESRPIPPPAPRPAAAAAAHQDNQHYHTGTNGASDGSNDSSNMVDEADSASGPSPCLLSQSLQQVTGGAIDRKAYTSTAARQAPPPLVAYRRSTPLVEPLAADVSPITTSDKAQSFRKNRRCVSSKELGTIAPASGSPYAVMMNKREELESTMRDRLTTLRQSESYQKIGTRVSEDSSSVSVQEMSNRKRNQRRAEHAQAVINDLCEVVTDLFVAESKLLNPSKYGVSETSRDPVLNNVRMFVSSLPIRYALGVDTPSEVLLHMRLMAAARSNRGQVAVHIHSIEPDTMPAIQTKADNAKGRLLHLVTISCRDVNGLLEYISGLLATGGSRVIDADVMLSNDNIVLDRFIVDMAGRLRLDMLSNSIEAFLAQRTATQDCASHQTSCSSSPKDSSRATGSHARVASGPIYHKLIESPPSDERLRRELQSGVPLTAMLASNSRINLASVSLPFIHKHHSLPIDLPDRKDRRVPEVTLAMKKSHDFQNNIDMDVQPGEEEYERQRKKLVDRPRSHDLDKGDEVSFGSSKTLDYVTVPAVDRGGGVPVQTKRSVPLIPFDELMLIETIGTGRVSTIYRAAWQRQGQNIFSQDTVKMVALKVAMKNPENGDTSHIDELRQEADIAARFQHACICDLVGVAADADCFCLAYEYCHGGSLLSLLTDTSRYYEYLPIALDIANGMAYLHSRNVIHRDLKPSNILLTKHHRAKIADFGMSVNNHGQELTAETGTYRYMAPEVIRHESYSSNADVYSFGVCLWQLIAREVPYATMTPIQAAYAVAQGQRPEIPSSTPIRLQEIIRACWDQDSHKRPSFTYIALALADYAKLAFSPANVGTETLKIANEMLATVEGNSTVNVDFSAPVNNDFMNRSDSFNNIGLEIE